jgi:hypothetical protein
VRARPTTATGVDGSTVTNVRSFGKPGTGYCDVVVEVGLGIFSGEWHEGTGLDHGATLRE